MSVKVVFWQNINKKSLPFPGKLNLATKKLFLSSNWLSKKEHWNDFFKLGEFLRTKSFKLDTLTGLIFTKTNIKYVILFDRVIFYSKILAFKNSTPMKIFLQQPIFERQKLISWEILDSYFAKIHQESSISTQKSQIWQFSSPTYQDIDSWKCFIKILYFR